MNLRGALGKLLRRATAASGSPTAGVADDRMHRLARECRATREEVGALRARVGVARRRAEAALASMREEVQERASLAAISRARLLSTSIVLEGSAAERLRVRRIRVGDQVERPFRPSVGVTRCASEAADVRRLWDELIVLEAECGDGMLRGLPSTILDVPDATVVLEAGTLRITAGGAASHDRSAVAVPRFVYDSPMRKLQNFGHWLLDCAPQAAALAAAAPEAAFLLPAGYREFHAATLALMGIARSQLHAWDGSPRACARLLAFENDGRAGGGRPLSPLMEVRRRVAPRSAEALAAGHRRVYVSRRDAGTARQWVANEAAVEALFRSRGFDVIVMAECPLAEQTRLFREARVVAGVSGAGLADLIFSPAGTHVIVLLSDSLIRWWADERGARSLWSSDRAVKAGQLAELGDSPRFYAHLAAACDQVCHSFVAGDEMPLGALSRFLDDVLAVVDGA